MGRYWDGQGWSNGPMRKPCSPWRREAAEGPKRSPPSTHQEITEKGKLALY